MLKIDEYLNGFPYNCVRFSAVQAIDRLTQREPAAVADALQKIVDENRAKDDRAMMRADVPVKEIVYRLRAR